MATFPTSPEPSATAPDDLVVPPLPAALVVAGIGLRQETAADTGFARVLYGMSRAEELARVPWPDSVKRRFLDDQFHLQRAHLRRHHPAARRWIIEARGPSLAATPIGRLYVDRDTEGWHLIEIALRRDERNRGVGSALIQWLVEAASLAAAPCIALHVARDNSGARRLYRRLGFVEVASAAPSHRRMVRALASARAGVS